MHAGSYAIPQVLWPSLLLERQDTAKGLDRSFSIIYYVMAQNPDWLTVPMTATLQTVVTQKMLEFGVNVSIESLPLSVCPFEEFCAL